MSELTDVTLNSGETKDKNIKFDLETLQKINSWKDDVDNMHTSKFIGEVFSEILQNDEIAKMEKSIEKQLAEELGAVPVIHKKSYLDESVQHVVYDEAYMEADEFNSLTTQSEDSEDFDALRNTYIVRVEDAEALSDEVNARQQSYVLNKVAKRLLEMPFTSRFHRLRSKEQLLKVVRGYDIDDATEWVRRRIEGTDLDEPNVDVFDEVFESASLDDDDEIDVSEMEPEDFDALEDGLNHEEHDMESIPNGKKRKHALAAVARHEDWTTEYELQNFVPIVYPDIETAATYETYVHDALNLLADQSHDTEFKNFVERVEAEIRERVYFEKSENVDGIGELEDLLNRDRAESQFEIIHETVQILTCLNRIFRDYENNGSSHADKYLDICKDISLLAIEHFQPEETDDVTENVLYNKIDKTWFDSHLSNYKKGVELITPKDAKEIYWEESEEELEKNRNATPIN